MQNAEIPNSPRFLKVAELAEVLKVKPRTIYEMAAQNRIPYRKPPGSNILRVNSTRAQKLQLELVVLFALRASRVKKVVANMTQSIRLNANQHSVAAIPVRH